VRTDRAYIGRVVASVRDWREHSASLDKLYALDDDARAKDGLGPTPRLPSPLEWWTENYALLRDVATRRYAVHVQSYDALLAEPERVVRQVLGWLGHGDPDRALAAVTIERRSVKKPEIGGVDQDVAAVFDQLYEAIDRGEALSRPLLGKLNETNTRLLPTIRAHEERVLVELDREENERVARSQRTDAAVRSPQGG
jgi:hypothetical protein